MVSMPPPALPHDVWLNIAAFLPVLSLRTLYSLNSSLCNIAFDARYRQVSFIYWDDRLLRNLVRLKDPFIARRVKILHIYPGFLKEVLDKHPRSTTSLTPASPPSHRDKPSSFRHRLADITQQLREYQDKVFNAPGSSSRGPALHGTSMEMGNLYDMPPRQAVERMRERLRTAQDVMAAMLDLLRSLHSLSDYYVTWYGLPTAEFDPDALGLGLSLTNLAVPLVGTPLLTPSLTKLSLDISLENIHALCSASFHVSRLEHLHLHLHSDHARSTSSSALPTSRIYTRLAHSLSPLSPYLRLLSIETHEPMDISLFFANLTFLSKLETLALALPVQKPHLGNPRALGRFLKRQAGTIKCLRIRATQHDGSSSGSLLSTSHGPSWRTVGTPDPWSLNEWIRTALGSGNGEEYAAEWNSSPSSDTGHESISEASLQQEEEVWTEYDLETLETLEISSNLIPLETALYLAERFGGRVKSLAVLGSVKSFEFVKELVKVLGRSAALALPPLSPASAAAQEESLTPIDFGGDAETVWQWLTPASPSTPPSPHSSTPTLSNCWNLKTLKLGPVQLSPELLDLLAHNLPSLQHLELIVKHFLPSQDDVPIYAAARHHHHHSGKHGAGGAASTGGAGSVGVDGDGTQLDEQVYEFLETMQNEWCWSWWGLKTIAVFSENSTLSMPLPLPLSRPPSTTGSTSASISTSPALATEKGKSALTSISTAVSRANSALRSVSASSKGEVKSQTQDSVVTVTAPSRSTSLSGGKKAQDVVVTPAPRHSSLSPSRAQRVDTSALSRSHSQTGQVHEHESVSLSLPCPVLSSSSCSATSPLPASSSRASHLPSLPPLPPLELLQIPSSTTVAIGRSLSLSTPTSPLTISPDTDSTPTNTRPYPPSRAHGHFNSDFTWSLGGGGGGMASYNSCGFVGASASTSALPRISSSIDYGKGKGRGRGRNGSLVSISVPVAATNAAASAGCHSGPGSSTVVDPDRGTTMNSARSNSTSSSGGKHGHGHVFSFLKSKSKSRKDKEKEKDVVKTVDAIFGPLRSASGSNGGCSERGGAVMSAHAGLLPIHGASSSVSAAFGASSHRCAPSKHQRQQSPVPLPPITTSKSAAGNSACSLSAPNTTSTTPTTPTIATCASTSTSTSICTPTSPPPCSGSGSTVTATPTKAIAVASVPSYTSSSTSRMWVPLPSSQTFIRTRDHNRSWLKEHQSRSRKKDKEKEKERQQLADEQERERLKECARVRDVQLQLREREREREERKREREREREERYARARHHQHGRHHHGRRKSTHGGTSSSGNSGRRRRRADPLSSFGSVSSEVSGISTISTLSGRSGNAATMSSSTHAGGEAVKSVASAAVVEERITFEVALGEVLGRCLPGVRVVR
ncbi:hypothetical protein D9756_002140 [Leucocoprinus leucothites]|uniref:F-box domain-containing protein n=1 Tax=Leucocoprinus leucothites TaxID=201217 RepID=A0A8H5GB73_9AGAR|nr:hypothetical protein D9756_002140 [Leucoagaricus leucothites]